MLEIAVCDDNGKDLDFITEKLHEICAEMREEYHVSVCSSPAGLLEGNTNFLVKPVGKEELKEQLAACPQGAKG